MGKMKEMKIIIPGRLPGFNEIIDAAKYARNKYQAYSQMKEHYTNMVALLAKNLPRFEKIALIITWYEPNGNRDPDNIAAGQKFIIDGLVSAGIVKNDNHKHIKGILHKFAIDKENPRIVVEIVDIEKNPKSFPGQDFWD